MPNVLNSFKERFPDTWAAYEQLKNTCDRQGPLVYVPENNRARMNVELMSFGFDGHRITDDTFQALVIPRGSAATSLLKKVRKFRKYEFSGKAGTSGFSVVSSHSGSVHFSA